MKTDREAEAAKLKADRKAEAAKSEAEREEAKLKTDREWELEIMKENLHFLPSKNVGTIRYPKWTQIWYFDT